MISTNFKLGGNLVIIDDDGKLVGIIRTGEKFTDITQKVLNALYTHESAEKVEFDENLVVDTMERYYFFADVTDFDGDTKIKEYTIELTATY